MGNKLKKSTTPKTAEKPEKTVKGERKSSEKLKNDREEKVDLKKLAKDERTWKYDCIIMQL